MPAYDDESFAPAAPVATVILRHPDTGESLAGGPAASCSFPSPRGILTRVGGNAHGKCYHGVAGRPVCRG
jgi:hypothetical protein